EIFADERLPGRERIPGGAADDFGSLTDFAKVKRHRNVVQTLQRKCDFAEVGVAGTLTHSVDGALNPGGTGAKAGNGTTRGHTEVVVAMKVNWDLGAEPLAHLSHEKLDRFGAARSDGIDYYDFGCPSL